MNILLNLLLIQIFLNGLKAQWCVSFKSVMKTRIQWNNGQRLVSKRNFFGGINYKYEPYMFSTVQHYHDYEPTNICCDGYTKVSDTKCEPICSPACPTNTHCIRPDICECDMGYRGYTSSANIIHCEPYCRPSCSQNAQCVAPNECKCSSGYRNTNDTDTCQPICKDKCPINSSCTKPDHCTCKPGYLDNGLGHCKPVCNKECPAHSDCIEPNICICQPHYKTEGDICVPICEHECPQHSQCIEPNKCKCNEGYETIEQTNNTSFTCVAKCVEGCPVFSECTQPNTCSCQLGYNKTETNLCEPICEQECPEHSSCSEPNVCTCHKGYILLEQRCQPVCEKACPDHSHCSGPNKCLCQNGYQMKLSSVYNLYCEPVCQRNCSSFGKCVQPNKCECLEGYEMDELEICRPVCSRGCNNGFCFQPEVCICNPGYLMGPKEQCEPTCSMPCQNGSCVEPEICHCHEGFKFQNNSINICEPVCKPECINGICAAPNVCICLENYEPLAIGPSPDHTNCQVIQATTVANKLEENMKTEYESSAVTLSPTTKSGHLTSLHPHQLRQSSLGTTVSANICNEHCQCWQEFDEFGPLVSKQCTSICVDALDKSCLDLNLCRCDLVKNQLICRTSADELLTDDPIFYMCNLQDFKATTLKPYGQAISSDESLSKETKFVWLWAFILGGLIVFCLTGILLYLHLKKVEDPIVDYEL